TCAPTRCWIPKAPCPPPASGRRVGTRERPASAAPPRARVAVTSAAVRAAPVSAKTSAGAEGRGLSPVRLVNGDGDLNGPGWSAAAERALEGHSIVVVPGPTAVKW